MSISHDRLSSDGVFANGVTAVAVVRFILDYEQTARVTDVAAYFGLEAVDVAAALDYYARHVGQLRPLLEGHDT